MVILSGMQKLWTWLQLWFRLL